MNSFEGNRQRERVRPTDDILWEAEDDDRVSGLTMREGDDGVIEINRRGRFDADSEREIPEADEMQEAYDEQVEEEYVEEENDEEEQEEENSKLEAQRELGQEEQETRRCWICFDEEPERGWLTRSEWRRPCQCSLVAHEECLLTWIDEAQRSNIDGITSRTVRCPQCKQPYQISSKNSAVVKAMSLGDGIITKALLLTIPYGLLKATFTVCVHYGQTAMQHVLGVDYVDDVIMNLAEGEEARYLIGAAVIPFSLVASRFDAFNFVLPLVPSLVCFSDASFVASRKPLNGSPALWICILPWLRNIYAIAYGLLLGNLEKAWRAEAGLDRTREVIMREERQALPDGVGVGVGINVGINVDMGAGVGEEQDAAAEEDRRDNVIAERWVFIEAPRLIRMVAGALLLPRIAAIAGNFLLHFRFFRTRCPQQFQRTIIGGCLFVVLKDMTNLIYLYNRAKGRRSRHIENRK